jgi:hypothetical protein
MIYWVLALLSLSSFCLGVATFSAITRRAMEVLKLENDFLARRVEEQQEFMDLMLNRLSEKERSDDSADWWKETE